MLGVALVRRLCDLGADVVVLVRDWVPHIETSPESFFAKVSVARGDVRDQRLLERVLGEFEIDTVFHLAAQTIVGIANRNPISTLETNIAGTWCVLEAARRVSTVKQIVVGSSDKAYGADLAPPYEESMPLRGNFPYDVSKTCADLISQMYAKAFNSPVAITRCGNFYGAGDRNWSRLVPGTIRSVIRNTRPVIRSSGHFVRDYLYIDDAVRGYLILAQRLCENPNLAGEAFNFATGRPVTALEMVGRIIDLTGSDLTADIRNDATNEIPEQFMGAEKAREILGWQAECDLDAGLTQTIAWYKNYFGVEN
jgi:CDP-glucose 4,6-dehydratase